MGLDAPTTLRPHREVRTTIRLGSQTPTPVVVSPRDVAEAIRRHELRLFFQPVVSLATSAPAGVEALLRWQHPRYGLLVPDQFLHVVEEELVQQLGDWVLTTACAHFSEWKRENDRSLRLSVNVDPREFDDPAWPDRVVAVRDAAGLDAHDLTLEITEATGLDHAHASIALPKLVANGVDVSLDDTGTGFNALVALRDLPVGELKIDRSFVNRLGEERTDAIVNALLGLAADLGLRTVAEGVETRRQADRLADLGVQLGQGHLFSRPVTAGQVGEALAGLENTSNGYPRALRRMWEMHSAGASFHTIAAALNAEGLRTPSGTRWNAITVRGALLSQQRVEGRR